MLIRYSRWDGSQGTPGLDADELLSAMSDDLMADGDPRRALERLWRRGFQTRDGRRVPGLRDLLERARRERQALLERYSMADVLKDLRERLADVLRTEREGIERRLEEGRHQATGDASPEAEAQQARLEEMAAQKRTQLDQLPGDLGGAITGLQDYEFMDLEAWRKFQELMMRLRQEVIQSQFAGMRQAMQSLGPDEMRALGQMIGDLNRMLGERLAGGQPDDRSGFRDFMDRWGPLFPGVSSLDELVDELERRAAQMQSLLESLSPEQRLELEELQRALLRDPALREALHELAMNLDRLAPSREARRYRFQGGEPLSLQEALQLMGNLHDLERLETELRAADAGGDPDGLDAQTVRRLLGDQAADQLEQLKRIAAMLAEAGYLEQRGDRWELTPLAIRKIGQRALAEIFGQLRRDRVGQHETDHRGTGGDPTDLSKPYDFGDPFLLDLRETLRNALEREGPGIPLSLQPDDFQVYPTELSTQCATVVLLDMSRSMIYRGCWNAAKRVALALDSLIRGQYPRDHLDVVGFSLYARQYTPEVLPALRVSERNYGTNMQHALLLARRLLARHRGGNKQIIMITDGEPTAHLEGAEAYFDYPTTRRTYQMTRAEIVRCTREGITINTFMLEDSPGLMHFVNEMSRINKGRALYVTPDRLGEYVLVDYMTQKRKPVGH